MLKVILPATISIIPHYRCLLPPRKPSLELSIKLVATWRVSVRHHQVWPFVDAGRAELNQIYPCSLLRQSVRRQDPPDFVKAYLHHVYDLVGSRDL